jgi:N12 class adenine-specific DNA methylase
MARKSLYVYMEYMCHLSGKTEEEIFADLKGVISLKPNVRERNSTEAKYLMADEYLSGNVREKLAWAKNRHSFHLKITVSM